MNTTTAAADATPTSVLGLSSVDATLVAAAAALFAASLAFLGVTLARRQTERHWRTENRQQRFITASTQLAHESAAVRIAGVAALESLIDDYLNTARTRIWCLHTFHLRHTSWIVGKQLSIGPWRTRPIRGYRIHTQHFILAQQTVNVLCAYLRIPASTPPTNTPTLTTQTITKRLGRTPGNSTGHQIEQQHNYQPNDQQVRATITRTIATHLTPHTPGQQWSHLTYDFTNAHFNHTVSLRDVQFHSNARFNHVQFHRDVVFDGAHFHATR